MVTAPRARERVCDMLAASEEAFRQVAEEIAGNLAVAIHTPDGSFIRTPLLYPSGATVVLRLYGARNRRLTVTGITAKLGAHWTECPLQARGQDMKPH
jgi:hypothetical protein